MRILKQGKKVAPPHPSIVEIIDRIAELPQDELPAYLGAMSAWTLPRSDLHSWVKVLNKFDEILKGFIDTYDIDKLQLKGFTPLDKETIMEILRFETLLLDNSTNRKLFASYDRINSLLFSNDTDVIVGVLQLLLRPSQQYSSQPSASHTQNVSTKRLISLASRWSSIREHGSSFAEVLNPAKSFDFPKVASQVTFTYYMKFQPSSVNKNETSVSQTPSKAKAPSPSVPTTPAAGTSFSQPAPVNSGMVTVHIPSLADSNKGAVDLLREQLETHEISDEEKFDLLCRIRVALSLGPGPEKRKERDNLAIIRLLALAIFAHTNSENEAQSAFFVYEPDLISEVASLLQPEHPIPLSVQIAAIATLDAFARYRGRAGEVLSATNAGVTHGILMSLMRRLVHNLNDPQTKVTFEFADSLISFIILLTQNPAGGSMIVGAGLLPLLVQILQNRDESRLQVVSKTTNLVDTVLYGFGNGFNSFCNNRGVDVLVSRIEHEVDLDLQNNRVDNTSEGSLYGHLPYPRAVLLKHIMRTMHRIMQVSGGSENLRGLIDTSLSKSVKKIMEHRGLFGSAIFSIAINIMAAFVHNEPTSLTVIQEAGLPNAFYKAIESGVESSTEVITALPGAIGALCLNQAGLEGLSNLPTIIPQIFSILTSERHIRTLQEKDNATYIGGGFDELVRHHPPLKKPVFDAVIATFNRIEELGGSFAVPPPDAALYGLVPQQSEDTEMVTAAAEASRAASQAETLRSTDSGNGDGSESNVEKPNLIVAYIDIFGRFLDGLFQHIPHCREFVTGHDGIERICKLYSLPALPVNFFESNAAASLVSIVRNMAEAVTVPTLERLSKQVQLSMDETRELWNSEVNLPNLGFLADRGKTSHSDANSRFRQLVSLNSRINLLSQVYSSVGYTHSRSPNSIAQVVSGEAGSKLIRDLGIMYRTFLWELLTLIGPDPYKGVTVSGNQIALSSPLTADAVGGGANSTSNVTPLAPNGPSDNKAREQNIKAVKGMIQTLTKSMTPFFQAVTKLFLYNRRTADFVQRKQANTLAKLIVKDVLLEHLKWRGSDDKVISFSYTALVLGLIATLLFDERTSQNSLHTLMLLTMWQVDALHTIVDVCDSFISTLRTSAKQVSMNPNSDKASEAAAAFVGLEVVLRLFQALVSSRPLMDSGQTSTLVARDKPKNHPDYFEPHDFLVKLRSLFIPVLFEVWDADWLDQAPLGVVKPAVAGFLEVMAAENEGDSSGNLSTEPSDIPRIFNGGSRRITPVVPDEARVQQLCDMGFPRAAVERALIRAHNNLTAATEYLLSHPFALMAPVAAEQQVPAPPDQQIQEGSQNGGDNQDETMAPENADPPPVPAANVPTGGDGDTDSAGTPSSSGQEGDPPSSTEPRDETDYASELQLIRDAAAPGIASKALFIIDKHPDLVFEVKRAFIGPDDKYQARTAKELLTDPDLFSPSDASDTAFAVRLRLIALVAGESRSALDSGDQDRILQSFVKRLYGMEITANAVIPPWLAPLLLVMETLLVLGDEIHPVEVPKPDEEVPSPQLKIAAPNTEVRRVLFDFCLQLLSASNLDKNNLISCLRLLVLLTRDHRLAVEFLRAGAISKLLDLFKTPTNDTRGCQVHAIILLRHIIEDRGVLESVMKQDLVRTLTQPRLRVYDVWSFVRNNSHLALRDMSVFIDACRSICSLTSSTSSGSNFNVSLKEDKKPEPVKETPFDPPVVPIVAEAQPLDATVDEGIPPQFSEPLDTLLKSLVSEVLRVGRSVIATLAQPGFSPLESPEMPSNDDQLAKTGTEMSEFVYACFLLQCLTELLSAYNVCKSAFVSYTRKRSTQAKDAPKQKNAILHFLLSDLLFFTDPEAAPMNADKGRAILSDCAMSVVVALCADPSSATTMKEIPSEVVAARKLVLDVISRGLKETHAAESLESRYSRLGALAELSSRLLARPITSPTNRSLSESTLHISKLMLEKNFVALLTTTLGEIDPNFPNVRGLVAAVLRPLELLTKTAIKMGRAADKTKVAGSLLGPDESESSDFSMNEDEDDASSDRGETPDLYRNSALGMYGGEMEDMSYPNNDEVMDEDEEEADDLDMEYGDEEIGTDHTSETSEDEDEAGEDVDAVSEGEEEQEVWVEEEESAGDEPDDEEGGGDVELEADEMVWEDEPDGMESDPLADVRDRLEDAVDLMQVQGGNEEDEEDDEEAGPDDGPELVALDIGIPPPVDDGSIWHYTNGSLESPVPGIGMIVNGTEPHSRRSRLIDMDQYMQMQRARARPGAFPAPDPSMHPLLAEAINRGSGQLPAPHPSRLSHSRRLLRARDLLGESSEVAHGFLNMIHDLIGEDGYQMIEHIMTRGGPSADTVVELRAGNGQPISIAHLASHRGAARPAAQANVTPTDNRLLEATRQVQEFSPITTPQRWIDEGKMTQGRNATERLSALVNYVVIALLPEFRAKEAAQKREASEKSAAAAREAEAQERKDKNDAEAAEAAEAAEVASVGNSDKQEPALDAPDPDEHVAQAPALPEPARMDTDIPASVNVPSPDVVMADAAELDHESPAAVPDTTSSQENVTEDSNRPAAEAGDASVIQHNSEEQEASTSANRVTVLVNGNPVDITDTGIDPTFLEALPDDMREDVINQHLRERRAAQPVVRPAESQISPEFLEALPPDIRAEILQQEQEAIDRARRDRERGEAGADAPAGPSDIDSASFLASLDPQLRETVLMEQDDTFLQTLPSSLLAGAINGERSIRRATYRPRTTGVPTANASQPPKKPVIPRDAIQLLDKPDVAVLIRLLFFPHVLKRNSLHKILVNLCENSKTRIDIFSLLLGVLQDDPSDVLAVDRSFAQLSFRSNKVGPSSKTPTKSKSVEVASSSIPLQLPAENIPHLITHRSLDALTFIVTANEHAAQYFLSEQDVPPFAKKPGSKKGKGKEKQMPQAQFPLNLLLGLLDRKALLQSPPMMSAIALLLANVTKPLAALKEPASSSEGNKENELPNSNGANPLGNDGVATAETNEQPPTASPNFDDFTQKLRSDPPHIPSSSLCLIPNFLTAGECSGRTFQLALSLIQHLSYLSEVRLVVADELKLRAEGLGVNLQSDLEHLVHALEQASDSEDIPSSILSRFSPASADQAKLLRVLKTIDFMFTPKSPSTAPDASNSKDDGERQQEVHKIYEGFNFGPLWNGLGKALSVVESKPNLDHIATVLLPLIESLMVVCKHVSSKTTTTNPASSPLSPRISSIPLDPTEDLFVSFTDAHRKVLNVMVRNNPSLMSGAFSLLVNNPKVLDFDSKRNYFNQQLRRRTSPREHHPTLQLNVRRQHVFEDSYQYLHRKTGDQIKYGKLNVRFYNEEGVDAGGVTREWFQILARQMFNPNYALFQPCAGDKLTYQPNRASAINPEHLLFFKFVGRVIGKAIYDGRLLDAYFARSLYRQILGKPVDYRDVEWVDPEYYNSLCWILDNDPTALEMNFTVEAEEFGVRKVIELKEGGASIPVTQENKREFVQLSAQYRLYLSIKDQIESLLGGFYEIIPKELISIFNEQEVELLISGTPDIDIDEWRAATDYHGYTQSDPVIQWWWRALKSFSRDERAKVLSFATGTSRVPLGGFGELQGVQGVQKFSIHRAYGETDRLPQAHTCFNQIDLPEYSSYEKLRTQLLTAINEGGEGFGFA